MFFECCLQLNLAANFLAQDFPELVYFLACSPMSYTITRAERSIITTTNEMLPCTASFVDVLLFKPPEFTPYDFPADIIRLRTSNGNQIYATFLQRRDAKITILYSHGNAEDLNTCYWYLRKLSRKLKVNVLAYDYSGYGKSTGEYYRIVPTFEWVDRNSLFSHVALFRDLFQDKQAKIIAMLTSMRHMNI